MPTDEHFTSGVQHLENFFKSIVVVIRVGNTAVLAGVGLVQNQLHLGVMFLILGVAEYISKILGVHHKNFVKPLKISGFELSRTLACDVNAIFPGSIDGASVGQFADMPEACSGTIHRPVQSIFDDFVLHDSFCQRTSTDIAEADH